MRLSDYLTRNGISKADFAAQLDVSDEAVRLWCNGERFPSPNIVLAIREITKGAVQPNDFYELQEKSNGLAG